MSATTSLTELRNMQVADLQREVRAQRLSVAKMRLGIKMGKEKNSGKYQREKKNLSRMLTVLAEKQQTSLSKDAEPAKVAPAKKVASPKKATTSSPTKK